MSSDQGLRICVVCLGNICRSPMAEAVLRDRLERAGLTAAVDSAGTGAWHIGHDADRRALAALRRRGYALDGHRARQLSRGDLSTRDLILALDAQNLADIERLAGGPDPERIRLLGAFLAGSDRDLDVPDPYSGGAADFDHALDLIERASDGLVSHMLSPSSG